MYDNLGAQPGVPPANTQATPFGNAFSGASSGFIRGGLGAYGEKKSLDQVLTKDCLIDPGNYPDGRARKEKISRYFSDPQYYFQVNDQYVRNKLKVVLLPFLHRGHWTRITEPVGGRLSYKPPIYDINAPDLYIPFMAFGTYVVLAGLSLGLQGRFSPEALSWLFIKGLVGWFLQVSVLKMTLLSLGSVEAPLLDIVSYAGYAFAGLSIALMGTIIWNYSYYFLMPWTCLCMGVFLVKTIKRVLFAELSSSLAVCAFSEVKQAVFLKYKKRIAEDFFGSILVVWEYGTSFMLSLFDLIQVERTANIPEPGMQLGFGMLSSCEGTDAYSVIQ
ncbi:hypothetical protein K7X08_016336 [Anisodus acutangulus]|uniref:Uncharacterized protein n=1 Tax=Anisodus acutangulus TaxID=402998 RepID=A0A9Q1LEZ5_9SOLA|nr:hypothetical protein K7X08_016336 [Anisodus acutangulus]